MVPVQKVKDDLAVYLAAASVSVSTARLLVLATLLIILVGTLSSLISEAAQVADTGSSVLYALAETIVYQHHSNLAFP